MRIKLGALVALTVALTASAISCTPAFAASISGTVRDSYRSTPVQNESVYLISADDPGSQVGSATTDASGHYRFSSLGSGDFYLYFSDSADRFWPAWWDGESDFADAEPVETNGSAETTADIDVDPVLVKYSAHLSTPTITPDATTTALVGQGTTFETECTDSIWGGGLFGMHVMLQSSTDELTWNDVAPALDPEWDGTYDVTIVPADLGSRWYRFAITDAADVEATCSVGLGVTQAVPVMHWTNATFVGTTANEVSTFVIGQRLRVSATLTDDTGTPKSGAHIIVQGSGDGVAWYDDATPVEIGANGLYTANVAAGPWTYYRFTYELGNRVFVAASPPVIIHAPWVLAYSSPPATVKHGKSVTFSGTVSPSAGSPSQLVWLEIQHYAKKKWSVYWKGWVPAGSSNGVFVFSVNKRLSMKGLYQYRAQVRREDGLRRANLGYWMAVRAK